MKRKSLRSIIYDFLYLFNSKFLGLLRFSENVVKCLPPVPWTLPQTEIEARKDFRQCRVFTIDPETAKDLDDALHINKLDDGTYEIGIHIADVSYFVKPK